MPNAASASADAALVKGLDALGLGDRDELRVNLSAYLGLLQRWNGAYNLTAIRDPVQMVIKHLIDSLAVAPYIPSGAKHLIDVGTGAGLPGVPLALLNPHHHYDLLDSNGKKTRFLFQVKTELGLANMSVHRQRVESWKPPRPYDVVLSRAFASLADMVDGCSQLIDQHGCFLAMKGARPDAEMTALNEVCDVRAVHRLDVPGLKEDRHLVELGPVYSS